MSDLCTVSAGAATTSVRAVLRQMVRRLLGESVFASLRGFYWSVKLKLVDYEPETRALQQLVPAGGTCVDVGGNFGQFASFLARAVGPTGKVHSFEPLSYNRRVFAAVMRRLGYSNVALYPYAVGRECRVGRMVVPGSNTAEAHLVESSEGVTVEMVTLDAWAERTGVATVDFIKIDVEGFELFVLQGAQRVLNSAHPLILCEVSDTSLRRYTVSARDLFDFLGKLDYRPYIWREQKLVPCSGLSSAASNYFFVHSARQSRLCGLITA